MSIEFCVEFLCQCAWRFLCVRAREWGEGGGGTAEKSSVMDGVLRGMYVICVDVDSRFEEVKTSRIIWNCECRCGWRGPH